MHPDSLLYPFSYLDTSCRPQERVQRVPDSVSDVLEIAGDVVDVDDVDVSQQMDPSAKSEDGPNLPRSSPTPLQTAEC